MDGGGFIVKAVFHIFLKEIYGDRKSVPSFLLCCVFMEEKEDKCVFVLEVFVVGVWVCQSIRGWIVLASRTRYLPTTVKSFCITFKFRVTSWIKFIRMTLLALVIFVLNTNSIRSLSHSGWHASKCVGTYKILLPRAFNWILFSDSVSCEKSLIWLWDDVKAVSEKINKRIDVCWREA